MAQLIISDGTPRHVQIAHDPPFTSEEVGILTMQPEEELQAYPMTHEEFKWMVFNPDASEECPENETAYDIFLKFTDDETRKRLPAGTKIRGDVMVCNAFEGKPSGI